MRLRDNADIGNVTQGKALEFEEPCGTWCAAAAVWRNGLEDEERRGCDRGDETRRTLHILCAGLCRNDDLNIDILGACDFEKACVRVPDGRGQDIGQLQIHADV